MLQASKFSVMSNTKQILLIELMATLATALLLAGPISSQVIDAQAVDTKPKDKDKDKNKDKCKNVQVRLSILGTQAGDKLSATVQLANQTFTKDITVSEEEDKGDDVVTLLFDFKKLSPCPQVGSNLIAGNVNSVTFSKELDSIEKSNKIVVNVSSAVNKQRGVELPGALP
jgi:hypothetical protein